MDAGTKEHSLLVEVQTETSTMAWEGSSKASTVLRRIPKGLYILL